MNWREMGSDEPESVISSGIIGFREDRKKKEEDGKRREELTSVTWPFSERFPSWPGGAAAGGA